MLEMEVDNWQSNQTEQNKSQVTGTKGALWEQRERHCREVGVLSVLEVGKVIPGCKKNEPEELFKTFQSEKEEENQDRVGHNNQ